MEKKELCVKNEVQEEDEDNRVEILSSAKLPNLKQREVEVKFNDFP